MIFQYKINGVPVQSGDIICTTDGKPDLLPGEFWRLIGRLLPGDVDHIVIYTGPEGRFVEAGGKGVSTFEMPGGRWESNRILLERATLVDTFYGIVYPLKSLKLTTAEERRIREDIVAYCLAQVGKPYNLNFLDAEREDAFYCSQLAYKAYQRHGISLNTGTGHVQPARLGKDRLSARDLGWVLPPAREMTACSQLRMKTVRDKSLKITVKKFYRPVHG